MKRRKKSAKRILSFLLALCMAVMLVPVIPIKVEAAGAPDWYCGAYTTQNPFANRGYYGQCTWYSWGRAYELTGKKLPCYSDARGWIIDARNAGLPVGNEPMANSIAVWNGGSYGHVAYVENVNGNLVTISEANFREKYLDAQCYDLGVGIQYYDGVRTPMTNSAMQSRYGSLLGYIYLDEGNSPDHWSGQTPLNIGDDFYAYILSEFSGSYVESDSYVGFNEDGTAATNIQISAAPQYVGSGLDPKKIWHFIRYNDNCYKIINEYCGWPMDALGDLASIDPNIGTFSIDHGRDNQKWAIVNAESSGGEWGQLYRIVSALQRPNKLWAMDVSGGGPTAGTNVTLYGSCSTSNNQKYTIAPLSANYDYRKIRPSSPMNIRLVSDSTGDKNFIWDEVPRVGTYDVRQYEYRIYKGNTASEEQLYTSGTTSATGTPIFINLPDNDYTIQVRAVNTQYYDFCSDYTTKTFCIRQESSVIEWPTASEISYGQTLSESKLIGGKANVAGDFEWSDTTIKPAPDTRYEVVFTPNDTVQYNQCYENIGITVKKTAPEITAPTAGQLTLGAKLSSSLLSGGTAINPYDNENILGSWQWCDSEQTPSASGKYQAIFIPDNIVCYYNSESVDVDVTVEEAKEPEGTEEHTHIYNSGWKSDKDNHWKECECGNKSETAKHSFVWESDEGSSSRHEVCSVCGYIGKTENNPGGDGDSDKDKIEVESVSFEKDMLTIHIGEQESLKVMVSPENATDKTLVWRSSDTSVAEVSDNGTVTAKSAGTVTITVESANCKTTSCQVTVEEAKEPEEHTHIYNSDWQSDEENHWKECECGNKSETATHNFVWESYEDSSFRNKVCNICGYIGKTDGGDVSNPDNPDNTDNPKPSEPEPIKPNDYLKNNFEQYMAESTADYVEISVMWEPTTPEEKRRYECFGKEKVSYILSEENNYGIIIENAMQGPLCFNAFDAVLGDYTIGRTYNIYPYNNMTYKMEEEIQFTLRIPTDIYKPDRKYRMICVTQNGKTVIYDDLDITSETITVRTNLFYAYALLYK